MLNKVVSIAVYSIEDTVISVEATSVSVHYGGKASVELSLLAEFKEREWQHKITVEETPPGLAYVLTGTSGLGNIMCNMMDISTALMLKTTSVASIANEHRKAISSLGDDHRINFEAFVMGLFGDPTISIIFSFHQQSPF